MAVPSTTLRLIYHQQIGGLRADQHVHHICENPACVEPTHLEALTKREHVAAHKYKRLAYGFNETAF